MQKNPQKYEKKIKPTVTFTESSPLEGFGVFSEKHGKTEASDFGLHHQKGFSFGNVKSSSSTSSPKYIPEDTDTLFILLDRISKLEENFKIVLNRMNDLESMLAKTK